jgi:hypothetical protein
VFVGDEGLLLSRTSCDCRGDLVPGLVCLSCAPEEGRKGLVRRLKLNVDRILSALRCLPSLAGDGEREVLLGLSGGDVRPERSTTSGTWCLRFRPNVDHSPPAAILEVLVVSLDWVRGEMSTEEPGGSSLRSERSVGLGRRRPLPLPPAEGNRVLGVRPRGKTSWASASRNELGFSRILRSIGNCRAEGSCWSGGMASCKRGSGAG